MHRTYDQPDGDASDVGGEYAVRTMTRHLSFHTALDLAQQWADQHGGRATVLRPRRPKWWAWVPIATFPRAR